MEIKTKEVIRTEIRKKRRSLSSEEVRAKSFQIFEIFRKLPEYQSADIVLAYVDCKNEVCTEQIIERCWQDGKIVAVPKVFGEHMRFYEIHSFKDLEIGAFGIREPKHLSLKEIDPQNALMILPGVAFDERRHRVGYGGGFYDRYLSEHPDLTKIALAFEFQVYEQVPYEIFDRQPEKIITEKRIII